MADQAKPKSKHKKLFVIIGIVLIMLLAVSAGVGLRWWQQSQQPAQAPLLGLPEQVKHLESLRDGDPAAFDAELDKALADQSLNNDTRYLLYVEQGHRALQNHDWQAAQEAYGKAQSINNTSDVNRLLGEAYYGTGDKDRAIEQYNKAIALIPQDDPRRSAIKEEYENRIKEIETGVMPQDEPAEEEPQQ